MSEAIKVKNLVKSYGQNQVVRGISFDVKKGEIFALLGVNGAGKTTTLECIEGLRQYDQGEVFLSGSIGIQLQSSSLPANIKASEAFNLFSQWKNVQPQWELFENFGLSDLKNKQYKDMSTGQKRRLHLALALINDPDILVLDEPTAGLDVEGRVSLHSEIRKLKSQGKTIVFASHDMAEVETLCDRIAILKAGRIAFMGTPQELTREFGSESKIYLKVESELKAVNLLYSRFDGNEQDYEVYGVKDLGEGLLELLETIKKKKNLVLDLRVERTSLEQRFMDIAKEE